MLPALVTLTPAIMLIVDDPEVDADRMFPLSTALVPVWTRDADPEMVRSIVPLIPPMSTLKTGDTSVAPPVATNVNAGTHAKTTFLPPAEEIDALESNVRVTAESKGPKMKLSRAENTNDAPTDTRLVPCSPETDTAYPVPDVMVDDTASSCMLDAEAA